MPIARPCPLQQVATVDDQYYNFQMIEILNADDDFDPGLHQLNNETAVRCYTELTPALDDLPTDYFLCNEDFDCPPSSSLTALFGDCPMLYDCNSLHRSQDPLICDEFLTSCSGQHQMESDKVFLPVTVCQEEMARAAKNQKISYNAVSNGSPTHLPSIRCFINDQSHSKQPSSSAISRNSVNTSTVLTSPSVVFDIVTQSLNAVDHSSPSSLDGFLNDLTDVLGPSFQSSRQFDPLENSSQIISDTNASWSQPFSPYADSDGDSAISVTSNNGDLTDYLLQPNYRHGSILNATEWEQPSINRDGPRRTPTKPKKTRLASDSLSNTSSAGASEDSGWPPSPQQMPRRRREKSRTPHLWKFMRTLLEDPIYNPEFIKWENKSEGVFRIVPGKSKHIASLWGLKKNNPSMTFDKLSRSLRWCRKYGFLADLPKSDRYPKKLCFRFAKTALNWIPDQTVTIPSLEIKAAA